MYVSGVVAITLPVSLVLPAQDEPANSETSIVSLISHPADYEGRLIRIIGVAAISFEGSFVCLDMESYERNLLSNCLQLGAWSDQNRDHISFEQAYSLNGKYILVEGAFRPPRIPEEKYSVLKNGRRVPIEYEGYFENGKIDQMTELREWTSSKNLPGH